MLCLLRLLAVERRVGVSERNLLENVNIFFVAKAVLCAVFTIFVPATFDEVTKPNPGNMGICFMGSRPSKLLLEAALTHIFQKLKVKLDSDHFWNPVYN